ncbi:MAG: hypothetical protein R3C58_11720 [Parvularculaceae bacterium]
MLFRDRRDLFLIVLALIAFEQILNVYSHIMSERFIYPLLEHRRWSDPSFQSQALILDYGLIFIRYTGYGMLGWLAFRRAQEADYRDASSFQPLRRVIGLALMIFAIDNLSGWLGPQSVSLHFNLALYYIEEWRVAALGGLASALLAWLIGAHLFNEKLIGGISIAAFPATLGAVASSCAVIWLFDSVRWVSHEAGGGTPLWLSNLSYFANGVAYDLMLTIVTIGFCVALALPANSPSSHHMARAA